MNIEDYLCLLLAIILQPTTEKKKILYLRSQRLSEASFPKNLKVIGLLGEKFYFFIFLGMQIEVDFDATNTRIKLHSFRVLK